MFFPFVKIENTKKSKSPKSKSPNIGVFCQLEPILFICIFSPKNTPQKWLFLGYFLDSLAKISYLCIVNTKEKNNALTSEKIFPSARGSLKARRRI